MVDDKIDDEIKMYLHHGPFWRLCRCAGAMRCASTDAACPGILRKPLDTAIGQLLALYCPGGQQGGSKQNNNDKMQQLCWPFWWPRQWASTIPCTMPNGVGSGLHKKPLNATDGQVLRPIVAISHAYASFFEFFHRQLVEKGRGSSRRPLFSIGVWLIKWQGRT